MKRRLYSQIYVGFLIVALLCAELTVLLFAEELGWRRGETNIDPASLLALEQALPGPRADEESTREALTGLAEHLAIDATLWASDGRLLAAAGEPLPHPPLAQDGAGEPAAQGWIGSRGRAVLALPLADGRWLVTARSGSGPVSLQRVQIFVLVLLVSIAIGSRPVARRITRRLERLQKGVEELGLGELSSRVEVEGEDEVAELARSFNRAAGRIQSLVEARRRMLASASHELRTPLTRIRVRLELLAEAGGAGPAHALSEAERDKLLAEAEADIEELDELIGDLLLAGRLDAQTRLDRLQTVDLLALLGEEAARFGLSASGSRLQVFGDRRALRRMIRNLLDNARRHGGGAHVEARLEPLPDGAEGARLVVADRGAGVPEADRERVFEPFYRPTGHREGADGGVGLGLALVREVARHHGGEARCLPREGGGTRFEVDIRGASPAKS